MIIKMENKKTFQVLVLTFFFFGLNIICVGLDRGGHDWQNCSMIHDVDTSGDEVQNVKT